MSKRNYSRLMYLVQCIYSVFDDHYIGCQFYGETLDEAIEKLTGGVYPVTDEQAEQLRENGYYRIDKNTTVQATIAE